MPQTISIPRLRPLYAAALRIYELSPWDEMGEHEIFGVSDPVSGQTGYVSIMGSQGEHFAVNVYLGKDGLGGFMELHDQEEISNPFRVLEIPQLQLSFEDRDYLSPDDRLILRELDITPRGKNAWPMFQSFRPGFAPWSLENDEIEFMRTVLEQTLVVLESDKLRAKIGRAASRDKIYCRVRSIKASQATWRDLYRPLESCLGSQLRQITFAVATTLLNQVAELSQADDDFLIDVRLLPRPIRDTKDERPYLPYLLIILDAESELILYHTLLNLKAGRDRFDAELPSHIFSALVTIGYLPRSIRTTAPSVAGLMTGFAERFDFKIEWEKEIPLIDHVFKEFGEMD